MRRALVLAVMFSLTLAAASPAFAKGGPPARGGNQEPAPTLPPVEDLAEPLLVVTVRAQGSNRFGVLYWEGATPSVPFDVFRSGTRITRIEGSTTGNNLYQDAVKGLRGTFTYKVCYSGTEICSNSITVVYSSSTETIRYAPECPDTGTATCIVTLE